MSLAMEYGLFPVNDTRDGTKVLIVITVHV